MIYLDNAATYVLKNNDVIDVFSNTLKDYPANPNSSHRLGYIANKALEEARNAILKALNLNNNYDVIFNSGATEGINHAIKGYAYANKTRGNEIISFANEHPAVIETLHFLEKEGFKVHYVSSSNNGEILYEEVKKLINKNTILVVCMSVNNEVGSINDLKAIREIVNAYPKCILFSDVTQSIGKIKEDYSLLDMFACSAHKFGGLVGSGILVKKKKIILKKINDGGSQEHEYRSGTVSLPLALSTTHALIKAINNIDKNYQYVTKLKDECVKELNEIDEVEINSSSLFPYIINFSLKHKKASVVIEGLSNKEIYVSSLSACNAKKDQTSYVLTNMKRNKQLANNSIRVSFSISNTINEVNTFIKELKELLKNIR